MAQCSILLVMRVIFNFTTERGKWGKSCFGLQLFMLPVLKVLTFDHKTFYKIFGIVPNCLFSKRKSSNFETFYY